MRELSNPPSPISSHDYELILEPHNERMTLSKLKVNQQTEYLLSIQTPASLDLTQCTQTETEHVLADLLLAFNLALDHSCLTNIQSDIPTPRINPIQESVAIEQTPTGPSISITNTITSSLHITVGSREVLDENRVMEYFVLIRKLSRHASSQNNSLQIVNMNKALSEFESAMIAQNRLTLFRSLYTALMLAVNWDGKERTGLMLDAEIVALAGIQTSEAQRWRRIFDRTKQIGRAHV
jgi:hypothetical protein